MSSQGPLVSFLVPSYNAARYLPELCESLKAQTHANFEVLIADDGSTDNTAAVVAPFLRDPRFQYLGWRKNRGLNQGLAILCDHARGKYWCSPGADDVLLPAFLEKRVAALEANPQAFGAHGAPSLIDENGAPTTKGPIPLTLPEVMSAPRLLDVLQQHNVIVQPSAVFRTSVSRQVLPFYSWNWAYAPDWFLWILLASTGLDLLWSPEILLKYRMHSTSLSFSADKDHLRRAERRLAPMLALKTAATYSGWAAQAWERWGRVHYRMWLRQALALKSRGGLRDEWVQLGAHAGRGPRGKAASFALEILKHGAGMLRSNAAHASALKRQSFPVSGLAEVDDPIFR
jgi:glycosyltransferase involved in cell wall biosynthesis